MRASPFSLGLTFSVALTGLPVGQTLGAILSLEADGGGSTIDLAPGETAHISIRLFLHDIDTGFAFATVYLDDNDDEGDGPLSVTELVPGLDGPGVFYDRSAFKLPADISHDDGNEYDLVMGDSGGPGWGVGTYIIDTLTITHNGDETSGTIELNFELGLRLPEILTVDLDEYELHCDWGVCPNSLTLGVGGENNPFIVNLIPGPRCDGDANGDGVVNPLDSGFVLSRFGCEVDAGDEGCESADQNADGMVDPLDVGYVMARFGSCG